MKDSEKERRGTRGEIAGAITCGGSKGQDQVAGGDVIWNHGYREKGGATSVGGSRRITLSCAIDFKNKMAIGQHFCLNICHFSCQFSLFFSSPHIRDVMLPSAELTQCSRVLHAITREFSVSNFFFFFFCTKAQETDKVARFQYRGGHAFTSKSLGHTIGHTGLRICYSELGGF